MRPFRPLPAIRPSVSARAAARAAAAALVAVAAGLVTGGTPSAARAASATGSLGAGGTVTGDISLSPGDEDRITVDLVEGETVAAKFSSTFPADVTFSTPLGAPADLGWGTGPKRTAPAFVATATGPWEFRVRAASGQGKYALTVTPKWAKKVSLSGTSGGGVTWSMPRGATVSGKVSAFPAKSWDPTISDVSGPGGPLLPAPVAGVKGLAKLPVLTAGADGPCTMTVDGGAPGGQFRAALAMKVPRTPPTRSDLSDGLTTISFGNDGLRSLLAQKCVACHTWASSAAAFKPYAKRSLVRVQAGQMPQGAPPLPPAEVDLLRQWIATGMKP